MLEFKLYQKSKVIPFAQRMVLCPVILKVIFNFVTATTNARTKPFDILR